MYIAIAAASVALLAMIFAVVAHRAGYWDLERSKVLLEIAAIAAGAVWLVGRFSLELDMLERRATPTEMTVFSAFNEEAGTCRLNVAWGIENIGQRTFAIERSVLTVRRYQAMDAGGAHVESMKAVRARELLFEPFDVIADDPDSPDGKPHAVVEVGQKVGWTRPAIVPARPNDTFFVEVIMEIEGDEGAPWRVSRYHTCFAAASVPTPAPTATPSQGG